MECKISCSFGEIIDKHTILQIKKYKAKNKEVLTNIINELTAIEKENTLVKNNDILFKQLFKINNHLWELEDLIRNKSKNKEYDMKYIECAESIHIMNDKRYIYKKLINEKYNSKLKEEKIYQQNQDIIDPKDFEKLEIGKNLYTTGNYKESMFYIKQLIDKYNNYNNYDSFYIDLLFSYSNICSIFNINYPFFEKIEYIIKNMHTINISEEQKYFCKFIYATKCLNYQLYEKSYNFLNFVNYIRGPNVSYKNMSFFNKQDKNKTLFVYDGGGLGDKIMLSRFIPKLCEEFKNNNIIFLIDDKLFWYFSLIFKKYTNFKILSEERIDTIEHFDYHCSLITLLKYLNINYETLYSCNIYNKINVNTTFNCKNIINKFIKPTYILNWKGNPKNPHEKNNRMMELKNAIPLFKLKNINWVVITKNISQEEKNILQANNIDYYGDIIDNDKAFYDTISILKNIEGVVSTDTSLPHLSLSMNIKTYVMLTLGCEWRWGKEKKTNWYPDAILLRQQKYKSWKEPINKLIELLTNSS